RPSSEAEGPAPTPAPIGWTKDGEAQATNRPPPDAWWPPVLFYPLRGAEGVAMVITLGLAFWVMATLVPEYCLTLKASADFWVAGAERGLPWNPGIASALGLLGFPYALTALLIVFLHDDPLEANPGGVLGTIGRLVPSFLWLCLTTGTIVGSAAAAFVGAFLL